MRSRDIGGKRDKGDKNENPAPSRRRNFLATRQDEALEAETLRIKAEVVDALPSEIPGVKKDDDIPVLTEIVPASDKERETEDAVEASPGSPASSDVVPEELAKQMVEAIEQQLVYELPTLIEASLLNICEDLRSGITSTMQTALREFITRRKQR
jgi:hypothetical protein